MPRRDDLRSVLIIGSGPIVIGQACEFDYSGTQAIKVLRAEGLRVVLANSNPATIMTDPELADATYVEPLTMPILEKIIAKEQPDALLPTVGGQTGLNLTVELAEAGVLERYGVRLIGASLRAVQLAEDRLLFKQTMEAAGLPVPPGGLAHSVAEARELASQVGVPLLVRPSFTLGGTGGGIAQTWDDLEAVVEHGLRESPVHQVLIEQSVLGWKEFELEVMSDRAGNFVVVCGIENLDAMGIHTGDSITVAPIQTLTDREYQRLRDMARRVMAVVGVQTGGANVQFAVNPRDGRTVVIEMNPRVSRSSALASKATGFPIAKLAALVAIGYTLDELTNEITGQTVAAYEPSLDYVVVKVPRWGFEKFPGSDPRLGPQMKSIGEAMAIARTFPETLQKALRSLENGRTGLGPPDNGPGSELGIEAPGPQRLYQVYAALCQLADAGELAAQTGYDPWFMRQLEDVARLEMSLREQELSRLPASALLRAKAAGFCDAQLATFLNTTEEAVRERRWREGIRPIFGLVDTCAAEFAAATPYFYSTYERAPERLDEGQLVLEPLADESPPGERPRVIVLGSGPNRIGQGIEFDYCCCHAVAAMRDLGYQSVMVNCNPETVSTDYDTSDRLYFEPLTLEDVLEIVAREQPVGVVIQFGGQTPLKLAQGLKREGVPIWGTSPDSIDLAEDRERFGEVLDGLGIPQPAHGFAYSLEEVRGQAARIGYPLLVRPSYVLGGRAMAIVYGESQLESYVAEAVAAAEGRAVLLDRYLEHALELDVDAVGDGTDVVIGGIMEHIEEAGVHSGDSACVLPSIHLDEEQLATIRRYTREIGLALGTRGLLNAQYAVQGSRIYVLEANPRASRTVPFVSKATGVPLARVAARVVAGKTLAEAGLCAEPRVDGFFVKESVLPFRKLPGSDAVLGPEMRSTGEVMGHAARFGLAFAKAELGAGDELPTSGTAFLSVWDDHKPAALEIARELIELGFSLVATEGTAKFLRTHGLEVERIAKVGEGTPNAVDFIVSGRAHLVINTPAGHMAHEDGATIRMAAIRHRVPLLTTTTAAMAAVNGIRALRERALSVRSLQEHYASRGS